MTPMPWLLARDFDRSSDLQVGMPPWGPVNHESLVEINLGALGGTYICSGRGGFPHVRGSVRRVENAGRAVGGVACIGSRPHHGPIHPAFVSSSRYDSRH